MCGVPGLSAHAHRPPAAAVRGRGQPGRETHEEEELQMGLTTACMSHISSLCIPAWEGLNPVDGLICNDMTLLGKLLYNDVILSYSDTCCGLNKAFICANPSKLMLCIFFFNCEQCV